MCFRKLARVGEGRAGLALGQELQPLSASALPCSVHGAPGSAPWEQLVPESAGSCPGESRTHFSPGTPAALLLWDQSPVCGPQVGGHRMCGHTERPHLLSRTWGAPCSRTPCPRRLPPSLPGPCRQQVHRLSSQSGFSPGRGVGASSPGDSGPPAGMGSQSKPQSTLQGFGYSKEQGHAGECVWARGAGWRRGKGTQPV